MVSACCIQAHHVNSLQTTEQAKLLGSVSKVKDGYFGIHTQTLAQNQCLVNQNGFTLPQTQTFYADSWAQYRTRFWAVDQNNALLCEAGQFFSGVLLTPQQGESAVMSVNLGAGTYYLAIQDMGNPSNLAGVELDVAGGPPGTSYLGQLFNTVVQSYQPESWQTIPFTIQPNTVVWLDGGTTGGTLYLMTPSQAQSFSKCLS